MIRNFMFSRLHWRTLRLVALRRLPGTKRTIRAIKRREVL
jgi:hypothetical protein